MKVKALEEAQLYCFDPVIALTPCYQLKKENLPLVQFSVTGNVYKYILKCHMTSFSFN